MDLIDMYRTLHQKTKNTVKNTNTWRLNNMLLNNQWITEEIKDEMKKYLETNDNEHTMIQNLWDTANAVHRRKLQWYKLILRNQEKYQINNLTLHLKELEKEGKTKLKLSERKIKKTIPYAITSKRIRYVGTNTPKQVKTCTQKSISHWWKKLKATEKDGKI